MTKNIHWSFTGLVCILFLVSAFPIDSPVSQSFNAKLNHPMMQTSDRSLELDGAKDSKWQGREETGGSR